MTSTPVTVPVATFFTGRAGTGTSQQMDVQNSFSDVLNGQRSKTETGTETPKAEPVKKDQTARAEKPEGSQGDQKPQKTREESAKPKAETAKEPDAEISEEAMKAAEEAAAVMLTQAAKELGISEEEVMSLLQELSMTPQDLLNVQNLQTLVMAAAGETDVCSLVTNEQMFSQLQNLTADLNAVTAQVAQETGLPFDQVAEMFAKLMNEGQTEQQPQVAMPELMTERPKEESTDADAMLLKQEADSIVMPEEAENMAVTDQGEEVSQADITGRKNPDQSTMGQEAVKGDTTEQGVTRHTATDQGKKESSGDQTSSQSQNPFAQNVITNTAEQIQWAEESVSVFDADTEMIMDQITDYMKGQITDGVSELEMQLHPENLGTLHVKLTSRDGAVTAQFTAQNDVVKTALESQMIQLKETFKEQGITVEAIEVTVESHKFDQNFSGQSQGNLQQDGRQPARTRVRRINLDELEEMEETEMLTAEEQLAASMLKENGGTVDYTA